MALLSLSVFSVYRARSHVAAAWIGRFALFVSLSAYFPWALASVSPDPADWLSTLPIALPVLAVSGMLLALGDRRSRTLAGVSTVVSVLAVVAHVVFFWLMLVG